MIKILKKDINLEGTLLSGQAFRINKELDCSFTVVIKDRVINIKEEGNYLVINSNLDDNLEEVCLNYLDLNRDYKTVNERIIKRDKSIVNVVKFNKGYKILKQDRFEMLISYIISQNNNVKRISKSVEYLSQKYGTKVEFRGNDYYLFPTYSQLRDVTTEDLRKSGIGFRDKYVINALNKLKNEPNYLDKLSNLTSEKALKRLMEIKGIGLKVASCILLFGYSRFDVYPIDTWVKKNVSKRLNIPENSCLISKYMRDLYGEYAGLVIQYLFNYERNNTL